MIILTKADPYIKENLFSAPCSLGMLLRPFLKSFVDYFPTLFQHRPLICHLGSLYNVWPLWQLPGVPSHINTFPSWTALHLSGHPCLSVPQNTSEASGVIQTITALVGDDGAISHLQVFRLYQYLYRVWFFLGGGG